MEIQLQDLIEQIKKDGVEAAEAQASSILDNAKAEADRIIANAKAEAEKMIAKAKEENERTVKASEEAIRQAGRNLLISFRESITKELDSVIGEKVADSYSSKTLSELIVKVVETWSRSSDGDISVLLNEKDSADMTASLLSALKERVKNGVTVKTSDDFDGGFRISVDNGRAYYDYSAEAVTEMLSSYLNPKVSSLMKEAEGV